MGSGGFGVRGPLCHDCATTGRGTAMERVGASLGSVGRAVGLSPSTSTTGSSTGTVARPPRPPSVPDRWFGAPQGKQYEAEKRFPCIGKACVAAGVWKPVGTKCQGYRDLSMVGDQHEWQHMCAECADKKLGEWLKEAMRTHRGATAAMYECAAELYLEKLTLIFSNRDAVPPEQLRPNRTSGAMLKRVAESCVRYATRVAQERARHSEAEDGAAEGCAAEGGAAEGGEAEGGEASAAIAHSLLSIQEASAPLPAVRLRLQQPRDVALKRKAESSKHNTYDIKKKTAKLTIAYASLDSLDWRLLERIAKSELLRDGQKVEIKRRPSPKVAPQRRRKEDVVKEIQSLWPVDMESLSLD